MVLNGIRCLDLEGWMPGLIDPLNLLTYTALVLCNAGGRSGDVNRVNASSSSSSSSSTAAVPPTARDAWVTGISTVRRPNSFLLNVYGLCDIVTSSVENLVTTTGPLLTENELNRRILW